MHGDIQGEGRGRREDDGAENGYIWRCCLETKDAVALIRSTTRTE